MAYSIKHPMFQARTDKRNKLLDRLGRQYGFSDRKRLARVFREAQDRYWTLKEEARESSRYDNSLHKLSKPLLRVLRLLQEDGNLPDIFRMLGGGLTGIECHEQLVFNLAAIYRSLPAEPTSSRRGRPPNTEALYSMVALLADFWEQETSSHFTQKWHTERSGKLNGIRSPIARSATFVWEIVRFIDPRTLESLPTVTRKVVAERRASRSDNR